MDQEVLPIEARVAPAAGLPEERGRAAPIILTITDGGLAGQELKGYPKTRSLGHPLTGGVDEDVRICKITAAIGGCESGGVEISAAGQMVEPALQVPGTRQCAIQDHEPPGTG
jgi:hypothetical protein